jgi:hypothetical protein
MEQGTGVPKHEEHGRFQATSSKTCEFQARKGEPRRRLRRRADSDDRILMTALVCCPSLSMCL